MARTPKTIRVKGSIPLELGPDVVLASDVEIHYSDHVPVTLEDGTVVGRVVSIDTTEEGLVATFDVDLEVRPEGVADAR